MRKRTSENRTTLRANKSYEAEPLEWTLRRAMVSQQGIEATSPQIFTDRKDGVKPEYDIRTDRFEIAREAMDSVSKSQIARRQTFSEQKETNEKAGKPTQTNET